MNDLISRKTAIDAALTFLVEYCGAAFDEGMQKRMFERLNALPSAQPKHGKWMLWNEPGAECAYCSVCDAKFDQDELYIGGTDYPKYCPECGARMENWHESE